MHRIFNIGNNEVVDDVEPSELTSHRSDSPEPLPADGENPQEEGGGEGSGNFPPPSDGISLMPNKPKSRSAFERLKHAVVRRVRRITNLRSDEILYLDGRYDRNDIVGQPVVAPPPNPDPYTDNDPYLIHPKFTHDPSTGLQCMRLPIILDEREWPGVCGDDTTIIIHSEIVAYRFNDRTWTAALLLLTPCFVIIANLNGTVERFMPIQEMTKAIYDGAGNRILCFQSPRKGQDILFTCTDVHPIILILRQLAECRLLSPNAAVEMCSTAEGVMQRFDGSSTDHASVKENAAVSILMNRLRTAGPTGPIRAALLEVDAAAEAAEDMAGDVAAAAANGDDNDLTHHVNPHVRKSVAGATLLATALVALSKRGLGAAEALERIQRGEDPDNDDDPHTHPVSPSHTRYPRLTGAPDGRRYGGPFGGGAATVGHPRIRGAPPQHTLPLGVARLPVPRRRPNVGWEHDDARAAAIAADGDGGAGSAVIDPFRVDSAVPNCLRGGDCDEDGFRDIADVARSVRPPPPPVDGGTIAGESTTHPHPRIARTALTVRMDDPWAPLDDPSTHSTLGLGTADTEKARARRRLVDDPLLRQFAISQGAAMGWSADTALKAAARTPTPPHWRPLIGDGDGDGVTVPDAPVFANEMDERAAASAVAEAVRRVIPEAVTRSIASAGPAGSRAGTHRDGPPVIYGPDGRPIGYDDRGRPLLLGDDGQPLYYSPDGHPLTWGPDGFLVPYFGALHPWPNAATDGTGGAAGTPMAPATTAYGPDGVPIHDRYGRPLWSPGGLPVYYSAEGHPWEFGPDGRWHPIAFPLPPPFVWGPDGRIVLPPAASHSDAPHRSHSHPRDDRRDSPVERSAPGAWRPRRTWARTRPDGTPIDPDDDGAVRPRGEPRLWGPDGDTDPTSPPRLKFLRKAPGCWHGDECAERCMSGEGVCYETPACWAGDGAQCSGGPPCWGNGGCCCRVDPTPDNASPNGRPLPRGALAGRHPPTTAPRAAASPAPASHASPSRRGPLPPGFSPFAPAPPFAGPVPRSPPPPYAPRGGQYAYAEDPDRSPSPRRGIGSPAPASPIVLPRDLPGCWHGDRCGDDPELFTTRPPRGPPPQEYPADTYPDPDPFPTPMSTLHAAPSRTHAARTAPLPPPAATFGLRDGLSDSPPPPSTAPPSDDGYGTPPTSPRARTKGGRRGARTHAPGARSVAFTIGSRTILPGADSMLAASAAASPLSAPSLAEARIPPPPPAVAAAAETRALHAATAASLLGSNQSDSFSRGADPRAARGGATTLPAGSPSPGNACNGDVVPPAPDGPDCPPSQRKVYPPPRRWGGALAKALVEDLSARLQKDACVATATPDGAAVRRFNPGDHCSVTRPARFELHDDGIWRDDDGFEPMEHMVTRAGLGTGRGVPIECLPAPPPIDPQFSMKTHMTPRRTTGVLPYAQYL